jgi:hypothetical protein
MLGVKGIAKNKFCIFKTWILTWNHLCYDSKASNLDRGQLLKLQPNKLHNLTFTVTASSEMPNSIRINNLFVKGHFAARIVRILKQIFTRKAILLCQMSHWEVQMKSLVTNYKEHTSLLENSGL